ncbi:hypothetical protein PL75_01070 [Neisseria arctica]|uniref:YubB ferredoxin-like domain-containing protein n=1 Tax=Neisseria arctica TaxID=1470200 RepID=A0A0J0YTW8_9NEIS|nr:hypothetical protein [Neisseria arctica]KLT73577.1 hypothetical protein PL75_01070 [Neisseria arctica]UOO85692.1 hypothetical protein LVJ86_05480 [Neisseria arctica]
MSNHVLHNITVRGSASSVSALKAALFKAGIPERDAGGHGLIVDFNGIIPEPKNLSGQDSEAWRINNWGTNNPFNQIIHRLDETELHFEFCTTCESPNAVFQAISDRFPELELDIGFIDACGWFAGIYTKKPSQPGQPNHLLIRADYDHESTMPVIERYFNQ